MNNDFLPDDLDYEQHEADHAREERIEKSAKARARRKLLKEKKARLQEKGYKGNY